VATRSWRTTVLAVTLQRDLHTAWNNTLPRYVDVFPARTSLCNWMSRGSPQYWLVRFPQLVGGASIALSTVQEQWSC
jgi:hypothetical protein